MEINWRFVPGYDWLMASDCGQIKTLDRLVDYGNRLVNRKGKVLTQVKGNNGYLFINIKQYPYYVHFIIAITFIGDRPTGMDIDHINGNRLDNRAINLRYVTRKQNVENCRRLGRMKVGENCSWSKLTEKDIISIRLSNETHRALAKKFNISRSTVGEIKSKKIWAHI